MALVFLSSCIKGYTAGLESVTSPKIEYGRIKENYLAIGQFFTQILPIELFKLHKVPYYLKDSPEVLSQPKIKNVIFILGESASSKHFQSFGYSRNTSPFFESLALQNQAIIKESYSAGFMTILSLSYLFNAIPHPNGTLQIQNGDTNLFRLAKQQKMNTYFYTSQGENHMGLMNLIGKRWVDDLRFPTFWGYSNEKHMPDDKLLSPFYNIDLNNGNNFVVLHQRASHLPYGELLTESEKVFGNERLIDKYDNTIYKTDGIIKSVFDYLSKRNSDDWILFYTSDHGQLVTENIVNQGNVTEDNYSVPLLIYTPNKSLYTDVSDIFSTCQKATHYQLSTVLVDLLGYKMDIGDCKTAYINSDSISGDLGYYKITQPENKLEFINTQSNESP